MGMLPPRASPQAKLGATNAIAFMFMTTKSGNIAPAKAFLSLIKPA
jgi:hypothetical protein